jgi:oxygen-dependent protoporphyrinogen oxidase
VRVRRAIPQYDRGHGARLVRIDDHLRGLPGLDLRGNAYRGVAVTAQLGSAVAPAVPSRSRSQPWQPT